MDDRIIQQYKEDEYIMIQLFVQWCMNHDLNPTELYDLAYPGQMKNEALLQAMEDSEKGSLEVDTETVLHVLQLFGNDDLAFIVSEKATHIK